MRTYFRRERCLYFPKTSRYDTTKMMKTKVSIQFSVTSFEITPNLILPSHRLSIVGCASTAKIFRPEFAVVDCEITVYDEKEKKKRHGDEIVIFSIASEDGKKKRKKTTPTNLV